MKTLVGMFAIINSADGESFFTAEIVDQVSPTHYLVQPHNMVDDKGVRRPIMLTTLDQMTETSCDTCGHHMWDLFEDKEQMQAYFDWLETPAPVEPTVVKLHKRKH